MSQSANAKISHGDIFTQPVYDDHFTFSDVPMSAYLRKDNKVRYGGDIALSFYLRYFLSPSELEMYRQGFSSIGALESTASVIHQANLNINLEIQLSGSTYEGLDVPHYRPRGSGGDEALGKQEYVTPDTDVMLVILDPLASEGDSLPSISPLSMDYSLAPNGFCRIRVNPGWMSEQAMSERAARDLWKPGIVTTLGKTAWLSGSRMLKSLGVLAELASSGFRHQGPALTSVNRSTEGSDWVTTSDMDGVLALRCPTWPSIANEWFSRTRKSDWISDVTKDQIRQLGCHVVAVGHHLSLPEEKELEWRVSFSATEKHLSANLTPAQRRCYVIFKTLCKVHLRHPKVVATYHLKTTFFWLCDDIPAERWDEVNTGPIIRALFTKLSHFLAKRFLPNYFIRTNNMIGHVCQEAVHATLKQVTEIEHDLVSAVMKADRLIKFDIGTRSPLCSAFAPFLDQPADESFVNDATLGLIHLGQATIDEGGYYFHKAMAAFHDAWFLLGMGSHEGKPHPICRDHLVFASLCSLQIPGRHTAQFQDWLVLAYSKENPELFSSVRVEMGPPPVQRLLYYHQAKLRELREPLDSPRTSVNSTSTDPSQSTSSADPIPASGADTKPKYSPSSWEEVELLLPFFSMQPQLDPREEAMGTIQMGLSCLLDNDPSSTKSSTHITAAHYTRLKTAMGVLELEEFLVPHINLAHWFYATGRYTHAERFLKMVCYVLGELLSSLDFTPTRLYNTEILPSFLREAMEEKEEGEDFIINAQFYLLVLLAMALKQKAQDKALSFFLASNILEEQEDLLIPAWGYLELEENPKLNCNATLLLTGISSQTDRHAVDN